MDQNVLEKLKEIGVYLHKAGFGYDPLSAHFVIAPLVAIWRESEEPTPEEIEILKGIVQKKADGFNPSVVRDFIVEGANTVTLKKVNGQWTFRRMTWQTGPTWFPRLGTLSEIAKEL